MADKNIQLQNQTNDNLYPKTKSELVMTTETENLSDKLTIMDAATEQAQRTASDAQTKANAVNDEIKAARVDADNTPQTHNSLKAHLDKIWTKLKEAVTNATSALTKANEAKSEAEAATNLAATADTKADNAVTKANQAEIKSTENTKEITNIKANLAGMIKYTEI